MKINNVEDPAAVLAIPEEEDVEVFESDLQCQYQQYVDLDKSLKETPEALERKMTLLQELLAQIHLQE